MAGLLAEIAAKASKQVNIDGVIWHIHAASSHDTLKSGVAMLLALQWDPQKEQLADKSLLQLFEKMGPDGAARNQQAKEHIVCAGVSHVQREGSPDVESCTLVAINAMHRPDQGKLWVGYLRKETVDQLYTEVMSLSTDGGAALERAASFREPSNGSTGLPSPVESVQSDPDAGA
jgi:hypothetical protein